MRQLKERYRYLIALFLFLTPLLALGQRKELREAEAAIDNEEYYIAKKLLEKAEPAISDQGKNVQARYYMAKGIAYLALNSDVYGTVDQLKKAEAYFKKVSELGKKADGESGLKAIKQTLLANALSDQQDEQYEDAYKKFTKLNALYPQDTLYLYAAATNAFQAETMDREAIRLFEELRKMGYVGNKIQYVAKNKMTGENQVFEDAKQRDQYLNSGYFKAPKEKRLPTQEGKIMRYLAVLYLRTDQKEKAIGLLHETQDTPDNLERYKDLTLIHKLLDDSSAYKSHLRTLIEKDTTNRATYFLLLGKELEQEKDLKGAETSFQKAIAAAPKNSETYLGMAQLYLKQQENVAQQLEKLAEQQQEGSASFQELTNKQKELLHKALPHLERGFELEPHNLRLLRVLYQSSWVLKDQERIEKYGKLLKKKNQKEEASS